MKKIILIAFILISSLTYSQKSTVDYIKFKKFTTVEKNLIDVSDTTKTYVVFDSDLNQMQVYKSGSWQDIYDLPANVAKTDDPNNFSVDQVFDEKIIINNNSLLQFDTTGRINTSGTQLNIVGELGNTFVSGKNIFLSTRNAGEIGEINFQMNGNLGNVSLLHKGIDKLKTTSTGVDVTGILTSNGATIDGQTVVNHNSAGNAALVVSNSVSNGSGAVIRVGDGTGNFILDLRQSNDISKLLVDQEGNVESSGQINANSFKGKLTTNTDPLTDAAITTAVVDGNSGIIITTTTTANDQTIAAPTDTASGKIFTVSNSASSTDIIFVDGEPIPPDSFVAFLWNGTSWGKDNLGLTFPSIDTSVDVNPLKSWITYRTNTSTGDRLMTLPDLSASNNDAQYKVFKSTGDANTVTVTTVSGINIIGEDLSQTIVNNDKGFTLQADFVNLKYHIIQDSRPSLSSSTITFFPLEEPSGILTYGRAATKTDDPDYSLTPFDAPTGAISGIGQSIGSWVSDPGVIIGNNGTNFSCTANMRRTSGSGTAKFYNEFYHRTAGGVETLIGTSGKSDDISTAVYTQVLTSGVAIVMNFSSTDRLLVKGYADRTGGGSDPTFDFQLEGLTPGICNLSVAASSISHDALSGVNQAGAGIANGHISAVSQTIVGEKTFTDNIGIGITPTTSKAHIFSGNNSLDGLFIEKLDDQNKTALIVKHNTTLIDRNIVDFQNSTGSIFKITGDGSAYFGRDIYFNTTDFKTRGGTSVGRVTHGNSSLSSYSIAYGDAHPTFPDEYHIVGTTNIVLNPLGGTTFNVGNLSAEVFIGDKSTNTAITNDFSNVFEGKSISTATTFEVNGFGDILTSGNIRNSNNITGAGLSGIELGFDALGFSEFEVRSWRINPFGGDLQIASGDGLGSVSISTNLHITKNIEANNITTSEIKDSGTGRISTTGGNVTMDVMSGRFRILSGASTTVTITDSLVTANSIILCTTASANGVNSISNAIAGVGQFTVTISNSTGFDTDINFLIIN